MPLRAHDGCFPGAQWRTSTPEAQGLDAQGISQGAGDLQLRPTDLLRVGQLGRRFCFAAGESIHTGSSFKYSLTRFQALVRRAGWEPLQFWTDAQARVGVHVLQRHP